MNTNGWDEWSKYVLKELERQDQFMKDLANKVNKIEIQIATLKAKSGIWGALAGMIPAVGTILYWLLTKK